MDISLGIDPASLFISFLALGLTTWEIYRNRCVVLKTLEFKYTSGMSIDVDNGNPYSSIQLIMRNNGVSLHDVAVVLSYWSDEGGTCSIPFRPNSKCGAQTGEFSGGMITMQELSTYALGKHGMAMISGLQDVWLQNPRIEIFSQGYLCKTIVISTRRERLKYYWNQLAWRINGKIPIKRVRDKRIGKSYVVERWNVPTFRLYSWPIQGFLRAVKTKLERLDGVTPP